MPSNTSNAFNTSEKVTGARQDTAQSSIGSGWVQTAALVLIFGFFVMGILVYRTYTASMPLPDKVVDPAGHVLFTGDQITDGQKLFQSRGLMEYGSVHGHGAYLGPDFTADYLRRAADDVAAQLERADAPQVDDTVVSEFRTNRYDEATKSGVVFRAGHIRPVYGPGVVFLIPGIDRMERVDLRVVTVTIPPQEVITKDNVPARVNAVVMFRVVDPVKAIMAVENYSVATSQIAQTTLRSLLGRVDLDTLLAHREDLNHDLRTIIEKQTEEWGVQVQVVEIKDVEIPESMQRAMAREAEAERERRAKVINARAELQASEQLRQASDTPSKSPASLQLRYLQTLLELGADQNSTVVFPLPVDIITPFLTATRDNATRNNGAGNGR